MAEEEKRPVVFIAVMGVTGSGKSSFIRMAAGREDIVIGHQLNSCTSEVAPYRFRNGPLDVVLVDTPGFNDTTRTETEVLKEIASWLEMTYREPPYVKLSGIIYLQSINDVRMFGSSLRNLKMFRQLCGDQPLKNVVLATTFWDKEEFGAAVTKEGELRTNFWEPMLRRGSRMARVTNRQSALNIIADLISLNPVTLAIQDELIHQHRNLEDTSAGRTVHEELERLSKIHAEEMAKLRDEMKDAISKRDVELQDAIKETTKVHEQAMEKVRRDQESLRYERRSEQRHYEQEIMDAHAAISLERVNSKREREEDRRQFQMRLKAQEIEGKMQYEAIVKKIRENEGKLRQEEREHVQKQIRLANKRPPKKGNGTSLLMGIGSMLGGIGMSALGFPTFLGDAFSSIKDIVEGADF